MTALSIAETLRRIDVLEPRDCCDETGWQVYPNPDGELTIYVCMCIVEKLETLGDDIREALHVGDDDVRQLPDARREVARLDADEGPE